MEIAVIEYELELEAKTLAVIDAACIRGDQAATRMKSGLITFD